MEKKEKPAFMALLTTAMGAYSKPLPEAGILKIWWDLLESFPYPVVAAAFTEYRYRESKFAPVPAGIEQLCRISDGRPEAEEAWTASLLAMDESQTIVWSEEMQEAFWIAHAALEIGDEVAARMSFKQAYNRLVSEARSLRKPVKWSVTPGKDQERYKTAYQQAVATGRLPAPKKNSNQALLLTGPEDDLKPNHKGLEMVKAALATLVSPAEKLRIKREAELQIEREAIEERKKELAAQAGEAYVPGSQKKSLRERKKATV